MAEDKLRLLVELDDKLSGGLSKIAGRLGNLSGPLDKAESSFSKFGANIVVLNQGLQLATSIFRGFNNTIGEVIRTADKFKRLQIQLEGIEGGSIKAAQSMDFLIGLAKKTPQTLDTLTNAFIKMRAGGIDNAEEGMVALTNAVSAFGGTDEQLKRAAIAIQQMAGKGVISMEELRQQLGEAVPSSMKIMARELGLTMKEMVDLITKGALDANVGLAALFKGFQKDFEGRALAMMDTWGGATSNFEDSWDQFLRALGETGLLDLAISALQSITGEVNNLTHAVQLFSGQTDKIFNQSLEQLNISILKTETRIKELETAIREETGVQEDNNFELKLKIELLEELTAQTRELIAQDLLNVFVEEQEAVKKLSEEFDNLAPPARELAETLNDIETELDELIEAERLAGLSLKDLRAELDATKKAAEAANKKFEEKKAIKDWNTGFKAVILSSKELEDVLNDIEDELDEFIEQERLAGLSLEELRAEFDATERAAEAFKQKLTDAFDGPTKSAKDLADSTKEIGDGLGDAFAGIGKQFAGQIAGVSGAISAFKVSGGDPFATAAGFFAELLLENESLKEAIELVNEALVVLVAPIAEAIAPALEALVPLIQKLAPLIAIMVDVLIPQIDLLIFQIDLATKGIDFLMDVGNDVVAAVNGLKRLLKDVKDTIKELGESMRLLIEALLALPRAIRDALKSLIGGGGNILSNILHDGGLINSGTGVRLPGMASDERGVTVQTGERILSRDEVNGGGGSSINITINGNPDQGTIDMLISRLEEQIALGRFAL